MTKNILAFMSEQLKRIGINYEYGTYSQTPEYPYWVGEHSEYGPKTEEGKKEHTYTLDGFTRGSVLPLLEDKEKIEDEMASLRTVLETGEGIAVSLESVMEVPAMAEDLHHIQMNLRIQEWRTK